MTLAQLLIPLAILFSVSLVFFGMSGGYYDTDAYDGNGTAHWAMTQRAIRLRLRSWRGWRPLKRCKG